jgi:putative glutamine amidotransferase
MSARHAFAPVSARPHTEQFDSLRRARCIAASLQHRPGIDPPGRFILQIAPLDRQSRRVMKPLVGISCCIKSFGPNGLANHAASDFCVRAVSGVADAVPVLLPAIGNDHDATCLLSRLDGILLTGSRSHIAPHHYGGEAHNPGMPEDPARDATTLPLIRAALARGIPIFAICRGMQELNVALGGTLFQHLPKLPGRLNHAAARPEDAQARITPAHTALLTAGGLLHRLAQAGSIEVNSLHEQGIDRLGDGLAVEAIAPDGTIEAVHVITLPSFALGVQWHPEFDATSNKMSRALFQTFGRAIRQMPHAHLMAAD